MATVIENETGLKEFSQADHEIARLQPFMDLKVHGLEDREGLEKVHAARMDVRAVRIGVEKSRVELKASAIEFGRKVDAEAKRIVALIEPIEQHLLAEESIVKREKDRLAAIEQEKQEAILKDRLTKLASFGVIRTAIDVARYSDVEFEFLAGESEARYREKQAIEQAERDRQAAITEANRIESERLTAEREVQEAAAAKIKSDREWIEVEQRRFVEHLADEQRKIDAEKQRIDREVFERDAKIKAEAEAKEQLVEELKRRADEAVKAKQAEADRVEQERLDAIEQAKQLEALKSDVQKLDDFALTLVEIERPAVKSKRAAATMANVNAQLTDIVKTLRGVK